MPKMKTLVLRVLREFICQYCSVQELITSLYKVPQSLKKTKEDNVGLVNTHDPKPHANRFTEIATFMELIWIISSLCRISAVRSHKEVFIYSVHI